MTAAEQEDESTEAITKRIWESALGIEITDTQSNFFDLGGDSIAMFTVRFLIDNALGVLVPFATFFSEPTLSEFARAIDAERGRVTSRIIK